MKCYNLTVVSDKNSWINDYIPRLHKEFIDCGQKVKWVHDVSEINNGDIAFYLSCEQLVPNTILDKNKHNIVVHGSKLPKGKGWSPMTWQIIEGENEITMSLFEAIERVDSGKIYLQEVINFDGSELIDELREIQGKSTIDLCIKFIKEYPEIIDLGIDQSGDSSFYPKRRPQDSELDISQSIGDQFNLLRVVDNKKYPAFFKHKGETYVLKIEKRK
ncbi:formyltransferase family protein [Bacillus sp. FJAT-45037]|uniref:formyltransferase family protein n=1 Tax=Bacillus sp. FJAT-45037 TaxID=2011007 RepID=UPI000C2504FF|nr:formyltransferase family protein [Bacillus sp. FJAT-45037]